MKNLNITSWVRAGLERDSHRPTKAKQRQSDPKGSRIRHIQVLILGVKKSGHHKELKRRLTDWQLVECEKKPSLLHCFEQPDHLILVVNLTAKSTYPERELGLQPSEFSRARDAMGSLMSKMEQHQAERIDMHYSGLSSSELKGVVCGLDLAAYRFKRAMGWQKRWIPQLKFSPSLSDTVLQSGCALAFGVNTARHLTNLPPNILNPESFAAFVQQQFRGAKHVQVKVLTEVQLKKERLTLLQAVGGASETPPRLVHIRYRPRTNKARPIALVGKGITFDTGGLDIKPSSNMRLMKKDMGGAAAILGTVLTLIEQKASIAFDAYLALAENALSQGAFRPSDVIEARNGQRIEIHNTDAEGRLVLADAMQMALAAKGADTPSVLIDVATLTGAIKTALGANVAGLFSNNSSLLKRILRAAQESGEPCWHMPLVQKYRSSMSTNFADMTNAVDGFGGAITAALFLESFVAETPWAHLDIYAWKDSSEGAYLESGASGQAVSTLVHLLC